MAEDTSSAELQVALQGLFERKAQKQSLPLLSLGSTFENAKRKKSSWNDVPLFSVPPPVVIVKYKERAAAQRLRTDGPDEHRRGDVRPIQKVVVHEERRRAEGRAPESQGNIQ